MKSIGGYLGLETGFRKNSLGNDYFLFNSGRSACLYYIQSKSIKDLMVPMHICRDFVEFLNTNDIHVYFYEIDQNFEITSSLEETQNILYVNYYGVKDDYIVFLSKNYQNLIIDNSQALFNNPINEIPTFYSFRKFIGVADGGALYSKDLKNVNIELNRSLSYESMSHLLKQGDVSTEEGFEDFKANEQRILNSPIARISKISQSIIESIDLNEYERVRTINFKYLSNRLKNFNNYVLNKTSSFYYPLHIPEGQELRNYLVSHKVYTPIFWSDQLRDIKGSWLEDFTLNTVNLPIDQRYTLNDMKHICNLITQFYA